MGRPKENVLGKSYTNRWLFTSALKGRSNGTNSPVKFYFNHGPQEPEIYIANIPGVRNMIR
jgi:hypothetical protein